MIPITTPLLAWANSVSDQTLFSTSFEKGDGLNLLQSQADGDSVSGVTSCLYDQKDPTDPSSYLIPSSIDGSPDGFSGEGKTNLFDGKSDTKYCIDLANINVSSPVVLIFGLSDPCKISGYTITSANDGEPRDPKNWNLYGSDDGENWKIIDSQSDVTYSGRKQAKKFTLSNEAEPYRYFKLEITAVRGNDRTAKGTLLCQFADLTLHGEIVITSDNTEPVGDSPMTSIRSNGPLKSDAAIAHAGFTGYSALRVYGQQSATQNTFARNVIYDNLHLKVEENTRLSYVIYPDLFTGAYDYNYTSHYMAIDLLFSDGTYLSELGAVDQNGFGMDPVSQGESEALYTTQWNYIESNIGKVAAGKTITKILVSFEMPQTPSKGKFLAYFDDLTIENRDEIRYDHLSDYITILRGTNNTKSVSRGIAVPLVTLPNGFNGYTPANTSDELLPYYYQENGDGCDLRHITVNHTASPWLPDANWGVWQMMVNTSFDPSAIDSASDMDAATRAATYTHANEIAKAHYYSVVFNSDDENAPGARMELTPTSHGAHTRFTYPADAPFVNLILGTDHGGSVKVEVKDGQTIVSGYSDYHQKMYVYSVINAPAVSYTLKERTLLLTFAKGTTSVEMKLATSYISDAQAKKNLALEISDADTFETVYARAQAEWDEICNLIVPEGASYTQLVNLYSALYRMYCYPLLFSENTGTADQPVWKYMSPYTNKVTDGKMYTTNGFWDTYRTEWPALTLLTPTKTGEILDGLLLHYKDKGYLARWLGRDGLNCMMGTHSDIILADAYLKGIEFDYDAAFASMLKNAAADSGSEIYGRPLNNTSIFTGYLPNSFANGMSWTMEDYINDYGIYKMAESLAAEESDPVKKAEYESAAVYYKNRALLYPSLFSKQAGFFMGKNERGDWTRDPRALDPLVVDWWADYAETNAWNMAFSVVYDMNGLAALYGGEEAILTKLDKFFAETSETAANLKSYTYEQRETRLGLSMYNNQVCLHTAYLYNYFGQPYKTQALTREILSRHYVGSEIGQGLPGDEDNGAMSAFYVLTALGLYETSLTSGEYLISSPLYDKVTLNLESGKVTIIANNNSAENIYVQSCKVNGQSYGKTFLPYDLLTSGDLTIEYEMGNTPSNWGCTDGAPSSLSAEGSTPTYLSDLTSKTIRTEAGDPIPVTPSALTVYGSNTASLKKLFDNTSDTVATLDSGEVLTFAFAKPSAVNLLTLTVLSAASAPKSVKVEYSTDGKTFTSMGEFPTSFAFGKYTLPVALPLADTAYYFLRLTLEGGNVIKLCEIELIGGADATSTLPPVTSAPTDDETETPPVNPPQASSKGTLASWIWMVIVASIVAVTVVTLTVLLLIKKRNYGRNN